MEFLEAIRSRRSIRKYRPDRLENGDLEKLLEAARLAPSAKNLQPYKFILVDDKTIISGLVEACRNQTFIGEAPLVAVACVNPAEAYGTLGGHENSAYVDAAIAMEHLVLAATALGLGTCWVGAFSEEKVREVLDVPGDWRVVALTPIGKPAENPSTRPKKSKGELFFLNAWGKAVGNGTR